MITMKPQPLVGRRADVVHAIARFHQLLSSHIQELIYSHLASATSCQRDLRWLRDNKYIGRLEVPSVGGSGGGGQPYVYKLGREGGALYDDDTWRNTSIDYHALMVADTYLHLVRLDRIGVISIHGCLIEEEGWVTIGSRELRPDIYAEVQRQGANETLKLWIEVDRAREHKKQITRKLMTYWNVWQLIENNPMSEDAHVVFVVNSEGRAKELRWFIEQIPEEAQALFRVMTLAEFASSF